VRFLFFMPLMLQTLAACVRPLVELAALERVASVNGAPIASLDDMLFARPLRGGMLWSAWVVVSICARKVRAAGCIGEKVQSSGRKCMAGGRWTEARTLGVRLALAGKARLVASSIFHY
jgi:hypothetical protein